MTGSKRLGAAATTLLVGGVLMSGCVHSPSATDMIWAPPPHMDFALAPRLTGAGADGVNSVLSGIDDQALASRTECYATAGPNGSWIRTVWTPYVGPRFLTVAISDQMYCGGAHPGGEVSYYTFDRRIDDVPDWATLWPAAAIHAAGLPPTGLQARTGAPAIWGWYVEAVRRDPSIDPELRRACDNHLGQQPAGDDLAIWLDGATGGLGMKLVDLPHAARACGFVQVMPAADMARLGASEELLREIREAPAAFDYSEMPR